MSLTIGLRWSAGWRDLPSFFFFNDTATTDIYTLSLHDALPIGGAQLQVGELTLAVGKRLRDPVHQHLDPAHREGRPGPKPADRDPLIQREVVAVRRVHPWDGHERLVQAPRGTGPADLGLVHELDRLGDAVDGRVGSGDRNDRGGQRVDLEAVVVTGGCVPLLGRRRERPEGTEEGDGFHSGERGFNRSAGARQGYLGWRNIRFQRIRSGSVATLK